MSWTKLALWQHLLFAFVKCFLRRLHKLRLAEVSMGKNIFSFPFLKIPFSSCYGFLRDFSRWLWEHKYYFIGKVWMHQQSLTWQQCTEACCIVCVRAEVLMGLLVITINVDPAGNCLLYVRRWGGPGCGQEKRAMQQPQEFYGFMLNSCGNIRRLSGAWGHPRAKLW